MERELKQNERAINATGEEYSSVGKKADSFNKELKQGANTADKAEGKFLKLSSTLGKMGKGVAAGIGAVSAGVVTIEQL